MIHLVRTNSENQDFIDLVKLLDADLAIRDGDDHAFYDQFNKIDRIKHAIVLYKDSVAVGCGAIKEFEPEVMEVKRMYTLPNYRGQGHATCILTELELWAKELAYKTCILETGKKQPEAIQLYIKNGYLKRPNYGPYLHVENSVCFQKTL
ncbi:MAG: GNAT family N-acetyltransferase [Bacteroidia bacterium]|nr:GNAT family N-acetyltransferase [Bacteroidia bacterium]NNK60228.1 GNAT family N-acetyltransferase [Flavobacteriaceae bacterium]